MSHKDSPFFNGLYNRLAVFAIRLFGSLPLRLNRLVGSFIGYLGIAFPNQHKKVTRINLSICQPDLDNKTRRTLARQSLMETGRGMLEAGFVWQQPHKALEYIRQVEGDTLLQAAVDQKAPVIILAPHLGCWELLNYWLSCHYPLHVLYSPSGLDSVDRLIAASRETFSSQTYPATRRGLSGLVKALKKGGVTAILPDQVPDRRNTHFAPFFNKPAATASLSSRLIQQTGATSFCCFAKRLPGTQGYDIIIRQPDNNIYNSSLEVSLAALNRSMEQLILEAPEQYLWSYKRFRRRAGKEPAPYA